MVLNQTITGNYSATASFNNNSFTCTDNAAITNPTIGFIDCVTIVHNFGGVNTIGGRQAFASYLHLTNPTSTSNTNHNYVAINGTTQATSDDGGLVAQTTLTANSAASGTTASFTANGTSFQANDVVNVQLDTGYLLQSTVSSSTGSTIVVNGKNPKSVSPGNYILDKTNGAVAGVNGSTAATSDTISLTVASITGFTSSDVVALVLDSGQVYTTTISGAPSGSTIVIVGDLPSQASSGAKLYDLTAAAARKGQLFSYGANTHLYLGAAGFANITGGEFDVAIEPGSSAYYKSGIQVVLDSGDASQGTTYDCGICVSSQTPVNTFAVGLLFGPMNGYYPVGRVGTLVGTTGSRIVGHGIDISSFTYNFDSFKAPGIVINGNGAPTIGSTTGLTLAAGELGITKQTASGSAPGAAGVKMGVVCGTNAGTAKIIAYGGTSTTPATVLDNIGSGVTGC